MQIRSSNSFKNALYQAQQQTSQQPPPQLIFAVMASPEVLKKAGRNCPETPEQMNLVELMCEFVEAMNPGLVLSKKPQILKDRDLTGELKDIWSAVQNFRDKEKAGVSDIVVYTEFGPESASACSPPLIRPPPIENSPTLPENNDLVDAPLKNDEKIHSNGHNELDSPEKSNVVDNNSNNHHAIENSHDVTVDEKSAVVVIEKLSLSDNASSKKSKNNSSNLNENESSEKLVKAQNQKNKESHHFLPKFLTSSKDKDTKEKEKANGEEQQQLGDTKVKTKKGLNFFRRNKTSSSSTGSPTHTTTNQQKSDAD